MATTCYCILILFWLYELIQVYQTFQELNLRLQQTSSFGASNIFPKSSRSEKYFNLTLKELKFQFKLDSILAVFATLIISISQFYLRISVKKYYKMNKIGNCGDVVAAGLFHCCNLVQNAKEMNIDDICEVEKVG